MSTPGVHLAAVRAGSGARCCRRAELAALAALRGVLYPEPQPEPVGSVRQSGRAALVIELPTAAAAERVAGLLRAAAELDDVLLVAPAADPAATRAGTAGASTGERGAGERRGGRSRTRGWMLIVRPAPVLLRELGMLTRDGRLLFGLPSAVLHGPDCCAAAVWRAALVATGPGDGPVTATRLAIPCPNPVIGVALIGMARRLGARARLHTRAGGELVALHSPVEITRLLHAVVGPTAAAAADLVAAAPAPSRSGSCGMSEANQATARRAAALVIVEVRAALAALEADPALTPQLRAAGRLRLAHPELSLAQLAARADPPISKDTLSGRLRRLLQLAARQAARPDTPASRTG